MSVRLAPEQRLFLDRRFAEWELQQAHAKEFREILLAIGGQAVVAPPNNYESDLRALIEVGKVIRGVPATVVMDDNTCHSNAAVLLRKANRLDFGIGSGFGLNRGLWRQHTWAMDADRIIETTEIREIYFGVLFYGVDAEHFCKRLEE